MENRYSNEEHRTLETLDKALRLPGVRAVLDQMAAGVEQRLRDAPDALLAWEPVPLELYRSALPAGIRSSWVFVLRAGTTSGAERHPNSHQRMMSWRGRGDMHLWTDGLWRPNPLIPDAAASLEARWVSIPVNVWHKPVMGAEDWVVVSFHTAPDNELIEERGDPATPGEIQQHTYTEMARDGNRGSR